jgi:hypothetical protein
MRKIKDVWNGLKSRVSGETRLDTELNVPSFASGDALTTGESRRHPWGVVVKMIGVAVIGCLLTVRPARAQLGIDLAAILAALQNMQSLMQKYIAVPLQDINQAQQNIAKYEREVMYPAQKIQQVRGSVAQFEVQFHQVSGLFHINVSSATLPQTQAFESVLLSRNAQKYEPQTYIVDVGGSFESLTSIFGGSYLNVGQEARDFAMNPSRSRPAGEPAVLFGLFRVLIEGDRPATPVGLQH